MVLGWWSALCNTGSIPRRLAIGSLLGLDQKLIRKSNQAMVHRIFLPLILFPATFCVLPATFSDLLPVRFILPCDLHEDIHEDGRDDAGFEQTPLGAGPIFSSVLYISYIFIAHVFTHQSVQS